jgi:hypothetical protein
MPVVGFLRIAPSADSGYLVAAFRQGLKEGGFVEGQDYGIEYRWADNQLDRLPALVADLLHRQVALIVGNTPSALAAKAATKTVPIVFVIGGDPVKDGLVASLNRPGGNVTGVSFITVELGAKQLGLASAIGSGSHCRARRSQIPHYRAASLRSQNCGFDHGAGNRSPLRQQRPRNRDRLYNARPTWGCCAAHW